MSSPVCIFIPSHNKDLFLIKLNNGDTGASELHMLVLKATDTGNRAQIIPD